MKKEKPSGEQHFLQEIAAESHIPDEDPFILHQEHRGPGKMWDGSMPSVPALERMEHLYKCLTAREPEKSRKMAELDMPAETLAHIAAHDYEW
jgi:hypothetical protein